MLKSLELFGFKSFADRTVFEFSPGITCVVGPNGSGKSNVVDALKWILGDQSAKSLRGKEMSDVIFNGSSGRRGSGFAEATLAFDNSQALLPLDAAEVRVGRRLYQSGDSEYLLNGSSVRLKDVRDMFMGTGAGTAAYSIIEQGRVDQILQANPTTRRVVFEEAAGISKFKSRRIDAERRLERVAQNLLRLTDIVDEVESQVTAARSQASKAARYRELNEELKQLWTGLAADDFRVNTRRIDEQQAHLDKLSLQIEQIHDEIEDIEAEKRIIEAEITQCDNDLITHERTMSRDREAVARGESVIEHQSSRLEELEVRVAQTRRKHLQAALRCNALSKEFEESQGKHELFDTQLQTERSALKKLELHQQEMQAQLRISESAVNEIQQQLTGQQAQRAAAIERLAVLEAQAHEIGHHHSVANEQRNRVEAAVAACQAQVAEEQSHLIQAREKHAGLQEEQTRLQQRHAEIIEQQQLTEQQLSELSQRRSGDSARLTILEELEQKHAGIAIGVQDILDRGQSAHYPPWDRVLGLVRDLIDVPFELGPIIDAALGERAQWIALSDLGPMLEYLNRGSAPIDGRIGFISLQNGRRLSSGTPLPCPADEHEPAQLDLSGEPGVFGRADRLIGDRSKVPGLASALLADTWIVETLQDAQSLLAKGYDRLRFVTLQGEVLSGHRELIVGQSPHESSLVSRKSEVRQLRNSITHCARRIEDLTQRQLILQTAFEKNAAEQDGVRQLTTTTAQRVTVCETKLSATEQELLKQQQLLQEAIVQADALEQRAHQIQNEIHSQQQFANEAERLLAELQAHIESLNLEMQRLRSKSQSCRSECEAQQLRIAKTEERSLSLEAELQRSRRDFEQSRQVRDELSEQLQQLIKTHQQGELTVLNAESSIAAQLLTLEQMVQETREDFARRNELRHKRQTMANQEEAAHRRRRTLQDQQHEIEMSLHQLQLELKSTSDRIFEEYQIPLTDIVMSGASAYQMYLTERYGDEVADQIRDGADSAEILDDDIIDSEKSFEGEVDSVIVPEFSDVREELEGRVDRLRRKIKLIGHVNPEALDSLDELETRYTTLSHQLQDLEEAKTALEEIIRKINHESQRIFLETFTTIRVHFIELFRKLFGGGDADLILEDPEDVLECGIDIVARPPGKELRSISLLSGGEKTMTAVALLFAMFRSKPSPYCILDEVDAALDEANVDRYVMIIKEFAATTQFVVITHRKRTMTAANILYGVTMEQAGISKRISVSFEDVSDNGEINVAA